MASDLKSIVKGEGFLKVTGSLVHWKSVNISETMLDKDTVTTSHKQKVILVYGLSNSNNCYEIECHRRSFPHCKPFQVRYFVFVACRAVPLHLQSFL